MDRFHVKCKNMNVVLLCVCTSCSHGERKYKNSLMVHCSLAAYVPTLNVPLLYWTGKWRNAHVVICFTTVLQSSLMLKEEENFISFFPSGL